MSDDVADAARAAGDEAAAAGRATIRIPANIMALLRQSYDSREKQLDWLLAIGVAGCFAFTFRTQILQAILGDTTTANAGRDDPPQASQDVAGGAGSAFPRGGVRPDLYSYNMPSSRTYRYAAGPSPTRPPLDPSQPPEYPE